MAQNITLLGATYPDVPAVELPKAGGGTARFDDTTISTGGATAADIFGAKAYVNGQLITGNMPLLNPPTSTSSSGTGNLVMTIQKATTDRYLQFTKGYLTQNVYYKISAVPNGTMGTPTATKGSVSSHTIYVTPSVTNSGGYIDGGTVSGTPVAVSASELVSGSETKTANGTYDVTNLASLVVNVSGGGGGLTLIQTTSLGSLSTSSTSAADTGKTVSCASTTGWANYDLLLVDISVDTTTNGRHTSTVTPVLLTGTSNVTTKNTYTVGSNKWNSKLSSSGTASTRQSTTAYGVYINAASVSSNTLNMTVYYRYNSSSTGTLNGTYTARVYGVKLIDLIGG